MAENVYNEGLGRVVRKGSFMDQPYSNYTVFCMVCDRGCDTDGIPTMISLQPIARVKEKSKRQIHCLDCRATEA